MFPGRWVYEEYFLFKKRTYWFYNKETVWSMLHACIYWKRGHFVVLRDSRMTHHGLWVTGSICGRNSHTEKARVLLVVGKRHPHRAEGSWRLGEDRRERLQMPGFILRKGKITTRREQKQQRLRSASRSWGQPSCERRWTCRHLVVVVRGREGQRTPTSQVHLVPDLPTALRALPSPGS